MTNKDVFKILLCSYGYDRNIKIETFRGIDGFSGYDIYAENKEGNYFHDVSCENFMFIIRVILDYMKEHDVPIKNNWSSVRVKDVCDNDTRNSLINSWDKIDDDNEKWLIAYKPIQEWHDKNNPCPTCQINKKDHWDSIHYNCKLNHTHSCDIMINHYEKLTEMRKQINITHNPQQK